MIQILFYINNASYYEEVLSGITVKHMLILGEMSNRPKKSYITVLLIALQIFIHGSALGRLLRREAIIFYDLCVRFD